MINVVATLINKHGTELSLADGSFSWRAFTEPLRYTNKMYVEESSLPEGMINRTSFRYIGPPEVDISSFKRGTLIRLNGEFLTVSHSETVCFDGKPIYVYGVLNFYSKEEADEQISY